MNKIYDLKEFLKEKGPEFVCEEIYYVKTCQAIEYRKRVRNRRKALPRSFSKCRSFPKYYEKFFEHFSGKEFIKGEENYDFLKLSLLNDGWLEDYPLLICYSTKKNRWLIKQGHHRIHAAEELKIEWIPVKFNINGYK